MKPRIKIVICVVQARRDTSNNTYGAFRMFETMTGKCWSGFCGSGECAGNLRGSLLRIGLDDGEYLISETELKIKQFNYWIKDIEEVTREMDWIRTKLHELPEDPRAPIQYRERIPRNDDRKKTEDGPIWKNHVKGADPRAFFSSEGRTMANELALMADLTERGFDWQYTPKGRFYICERQKPIYKE